MDAEQMLTKLTKLWNTDDRDERRRLLSEICLSDADFLSPNGANHGTEEYARGIDIFRRSFPRSRTSHGKPDSHHGFLRFRWTTDWNDGRPATQGVDFGSLAKDGRLSRLVSFDDPAPPVGV
jgi:hypothetical protein